MTTQISLESARVNAGFTIIEVSEKTGKNVKTIYNWENGVTAIPANMFFKLCEMYGIGFDEVKVPVVKDGKF